MPYWPCAVYVYTAHCSAEAVQCPHPLLGGGYEPLPVFVTGFCATSLLPYAQLRFEMYLQQHTLHSTVQSAVYTALTKHT